MNKGAILAGVLAASGAIAVAAATSAVAGAPGKWSTLASGQDTVSAAAEIGLARTPDGVLHVAWKEAAGSSAAIRTRAITASGAIGPTNTAVNKTPLPSDPALVSADGGLRLFFAAGAGSPISGLASSTGSASGSSWSAPARIVSAEGGTPSVATAPDGTSFQTWAGSSIAVHRGLAGTSVHLLSSPAGAADARPNIAADAGGSVWVVWCRYDDPSMGTIAQRIDPATGAPTGTQIQLPGSVTKFQGKPNASCVLEATVARREPVVSRAGGGIYAAGTSGYPTQRRVLVWRLDASGVTRTLVAGQTTSKTQLGFSEPALASAPDGRIWVAWLDKRPQATRIVARRSNKAGTVFGAPVSVVPPGGISAGAVDLSAQADRVDVVLLQQTTGGATRLEHTQLLPGLTLLRGRVTTRGATAQVGVRALDAGDSVAGVRVRIGSRSSTTNAKGTAQIPVQLTGRRHRVIARAASGAYAGASVSVLVPARRHR